MNAIVRAFKKVASERQEPTPAWGTPEHSEWLQQLGRNAFIYGHMGQGGADHDKRDEIDAGNDYDTFPKQSGA